MFNFRLSAAAHFNRSCGTLLCHSTQVGKHCSSTISRKQQATDGFWAPASQLWDSLHIPTVHYATVTRYVRFTSYSYSTLWFKRVRFFSCAYRAILTIQKEASSISLASIGHCWALFLEEKNTCKHCFHLTEYQKMNNALIQVFHLTRS